MWRTLRLLPAWRLKQVCPLTPLRLDWLDLPEFLVDLSFEVKHMA
jgi:hypothetical protein